VAAILIREGYLSRQMSWVRIENKKDQGKTIDLIYTLAQCSKAFDSIYENYRKNNNIKTKKQHYRTLIDSVKKSNPLRESDIIELVKNRKARYKELKEMD